MGNHNIPGPDELNGRERLLVQVPQWKSLAWLRHGFSTRFGGVSTIYQSARSLQEGEARGELNLGWTKEDDPAFVSENRQRVIAAVAGRDAEAPALITVRQIHSAISLVVPDFPSPRVSDFVTQEGRAMLEADGLMTAAKGVLLGIQTADCVPVFVVDARRRVVANFHAGWRGTAAGIVEIGVSKMIDEFDLRPESLIAAIGPSIGACCYSVGDEVHQAFTGRFAYGESLFSHAGPGSPLHLDLWEANRRQLLACGIAAQRIVLAGECTGCSGLPGPRRFFSHRREHGFTGRMLSVIGVA